MAWLNIAANGCLVYAAAIAGLLSCIGCRQRHAPDNASLAINATDIKRHIAALANDSMQGRKPFTAGEERTIRYITQQFISSGLEPGNNGSYVQDVPMVEITSTPAGSLVVSNGKTSMTLSYGTDFEASSEHE